MESVTQQIEAAAASSSFEELASVFSSGPYLTLGTGEQRGVHAACLKACLRHEPFLPRALAESARLSLVLEETCLRQLPPTMVDGSDNRVRRVLYQHLLGQGHYEHAARVLGTLRMDGGTTTTGAAYHFPPVERCDVHVQMAECYLADEEYVAADAAVTKAGTVLSTIMGQQQQQQHGDGDAPKPEVPRGLYLRYKSTYARVLDFSRKFQQAATQYFELSQAFDLGAQDELLVMLGSAVTCAILAPSGPQRQSVLGLVFNDDRIPQLETLPQFPTHANILKKMCRSQILTKDELSKFQSTLRDHQKIVSPVDDLSVLERSVLEHNMIAVGRLYVSIRFDQLGLLLGGVDVERAEAVAAKMIVGGQLQGNIDGVDGLLHFDDPTYATAQDCNTDAVLRWDDAITDLCARLNRVTDIIQGK